MSKSVRLITKRRQHRQQEEHADHEQRRRDEPPRRRALDVSSRAPRARAASAASRGSRRRARRAPSAAPSIDSSPCTARSATMPHLARDSLPLGHLRRRLDALQLVAKRARVDVAGKTPAAPARPPRRQIAGQLRETAAGLPAATDIRSAATRPPSLRDARNTTRLEPPAIDAPGPLGPRQRRGHPARPARPAATAAGTRRCSTVRRCRTRNSRGRIRSRRWRLGAGRSRGPAALKRFDVERERAPEARACEIAAASAVAQQWLVLLQCQREQRFELVDRQQNRSSARRRRAA